MIILARIAGSNEWQAGGMPEFDNDDCPILKPRCDTSVELPRVHLKQFCIGQN